MNDPVQTIDIIYKTIEIGAMLIGGVIVVFRLARATTKFETVAEIQATAITEIRADIRSLGTLMTDTKVMEQRQVNFESRMDRFEDRLDDLARGEGFKLPLPFDNPRKVP